MEQGFHLLQTALANPSKRSTLVGELQILIFQDENLGKKLYELVQKTKNQNLIQLFEEVIKDLDLLNRVQFLETESTYKTFQQIDIRKPIYQTQAFLQRSLSIMSETSRTIRKKAPHSNFHTPRLYHPDYCCLLKGQNPVNNTPAQHQLQTQQIIREQAIQIQHLKAWVILLNCRIFESTKRRYLKSWKYHSNIITNLHTFIPQTKSQGLQVSQEIRAAPLINISQMMYMRLSCQYKSYPFQKIRLHSIKCGNWRIANNLVQLLLQRYNAQMKTLAIKALCYQPKPARPLCACLARIISVLTKRAFDKLLLSKQIHRLDKKIRLVVQKQIFQILRAMCKRQKKMFCLSMAMAHYLLRVSLRRIKNIPLPEVIDRLSLKQKARILDNLPILKISVKQAFYRWLVRTSRQICLECTSQLALYSQTSLTNVIWRLKRLITQNDNSHFVRSLKNAQQLRLRHLIFLIKSRTRVNIKRAFNCLRNMIQKEHRGLSLVRCLCCLKRKVLYRAFDGLKGKRNLRKISFKKVLQRLCFMAFKQIRLYAGKGYLIELVKQIFESRMKDSFKAIMNGEDWRRRCFAFRVIETTMSMQGFWRLKLQIAHDI